jgi:hypothetical protein
MHKVFDLNLNFLNYKTALKKLVYTIIFIENKNIWPTTERESHNYYFHYNIIQFYRRTNFVGDSNEIRRWKQYRRPHRRNTSVGITVVGKSLFRR